MRELEFWFEFASTYSYLSAMRIEKLAAEHGVAVTWRPFLLGPIFAAQGWRDSPFNIYPAKGRYMWADLARQAARYGLAFRKPDIFPQHTVLAARIAHLLADRAEGPGFCCSVYAAQFAEGRDISDRAVLADILSKAGLAETVMAEAESAETKAGLRARVAEAEAKGVFGAPSFIVAGDLYWGDDRLEQALAAATAGAA